MKKAFLLLLLVMFKVIYAQFDEPRFIPNAADSKPTMFDINLDGFLDIEVFTQNGTAQYWKNDGTNSFELTSIPNNLLTQIGPCHPIDVDGDGDKDIVAIKPDYPGAEVGNLIWIENDGILFSNFEIITPISWLSVRGDVIRFDAVDFNQDGLTDFYCSYDDIMTSNAQKHFVCINNGNGFNNPEYFTAPYFGVGLEQPSLFTDFDNDGDTDIIWNKSSNTSFIITSGIQANGTIISNEDTITTPIVRSIYALEDFNNDGINDLIARLNYSGDSLKCFYGIDNNNISTNGFLISDSIFFVSEIIDFNNDGLKDIVSEMDKVFLKTHEDTLKWTLSTKTNIGVNAINYPRIYADANNDSQIDGLGFSTPGDIYFYNSISDSTYEVIQLGRELIETDWFGKCDLDGDGQSEYLVVNYTTGVGKEIKNTSNLEFNLTGNEISGLENVLGCLDLNLDGLDDLILHPYDSIGRLIISWNMGSYTFVNDTIILDLKILDNLNWGYYGAKVHSYDIDSDNYPNVIYTPDDDSTVYSLQYNPNLSAMVIDTLFKTDNDYLVVYPVNINQDTLIDYALKVGSKFTTMIKDTNGSGYSKRSYSITNRDPDFVFQDFNGDNKNDFIYLSSGGGIGWMKNDGNDSLIFVKGESLSPTAGHASFTGNIQAGNLQVVSGGDGVGGGNGNVFQLDTAGSYMIQSFDAIPSYVFMDDIDEDGDEDAFFYYYENLAFAQNNGLASYYAQGSVYYDINLNAQLDSGEFIFNNYSMISSSSNGTSWVENGTYKLFSDSGALTVQPQLPFSGWSPTGVSDTTVILSSQIPFVKNLNFGFYPDSSFALIESQLNSGLMRCDTTSVSWINYQNTGTVAAKINLALTLHDSVDYRSASIQEDSVVNKTIFWTIDTIDFQEQKQIQVVTGTPSFALLGQHITFSLESEVYELNTVNSFIQNDTSSQVLTCAYDPNDKQVFPLGYASPGFIDTNEILEYTIRFQNTGNDTAINVRIYDQLSAALDINSFRLNSYSHPCSFSISSNGDLNIRFDKIFLPDSSTNLIGSQGFVNYSISQLPNLSANEQITNFASIYFDHNPAITTNTVLNTIIDCSKLREGFVTDENCAGSQIFGESTYPFIDEVDWTVDGSSFFSGTSFGLIISDTGTHYIQMLAQNPLCNIDTIFSVMINGLQNTPEASIIDSAIISNLYYSEYQWLNSDSLPIIGEVDSIFIPQNSGTYYLSVSNDSNCSRISSPIYYIVNDINENSLSTISVFPNPVKSDMAIEILGSNISSIYIHDKLGRLKSSKTNINSERMSIKLDNFDAGTYLFTILLKNGSIEHQKLIMY